MSANPNKLPGMPGAFGSVDKNNLAKRPSSGKGRGGRKENMRRALEQRSRREFIERAQASARQDSRNRRPSDMRSRGISMGPGRAGRSF